VSVTVCVEPEDYGAGGQGEDVSQGSIRVYVWNLPAKSRERGQFFGDCYGISVLASPWGVHT